MRLRTAASMLSSNVWNSARTRTYAIQKSPCASFSGNQTDPYPSVGVAAREGYWNLDHEALEPARTFLQAVAAAVN